MVIAVPPAAGASRTFARSATGAPATSTTRVPSRAVGRRSAAPLVGLGDRQPVAHDRAREVGQVVGGQLTLRHDAGTVTDGGHRRLVTLRACLDALRLLEGRVGQHREDGGRGGRVVDRLGDLHAHTLGHRLRSRVGGPAGARVVGNRGQGVVRLLQLAAQPGQLAGANHGHPVEQLLEPLALSGAGLGVDAARPRGLDDELPVDDEVGAGQVGRELARPGRRLDGRRRPGLQQACPPGRARWPPARAGAARARWRRGVTVAGVGTPIRRGR